MFWVARNTVLDPRWCIVYTTYNYLIMRFAISRFTRRLFGLLRRDGPISFAFLIVGGPRSSRKRTLICTTTTTTHCTIIVGNRESHCPGIIFF